MKKRKPTQIIRKKLTSGLALLAVCALILAGFSGCGSASSKSSRNGTSTVSTYTADADAGFYQETASDLAPEEESIGAFGNTLSDLESAESGEDSSQKLIKTVNMNLETTDFDTLLEELQTRTEEMGGYVESEDISTPGGANELRWAYLKVRIPEDSLDEFLAMVGENANVIYDSESVEDVTLTYVDLETHIDELRTEQKTLESLLKDAEDIEDIIAIQEQLTEIRYEIESYESQLKVLENRVSYSTVYLDISEVERETALGASTFGDNVRNRLNDSIYLLRNGLRSFAIGFLGSLPIILLVAAIAVAVILIVWGCVRHSRKKRKVGKWAEKKPEKQAEKTLPDKEEEDDIEKYWYGSADEEGTGTGDKADDKAGADKEDEARNKNADGDKNEPDEQENPDIKGNPE